MVAATYPCCDQIRLQELNHRRSVAKIGFADSPEPRDADDATEAVLECEEDVGVDGRAEGSVDNFVPAILNDAKLPT